MPADTAGIGIAGDEMERPGRGRRPDPDLTVDRPSRVEGADPRGERGSGRQRHALGGGLLAVAGRQELVFRNRCTTSRGPLIDRLACRDDVACGEVNRFARDTDGRRVDSVGAVGESVPALEAEEEALGRIDPGTVPLVQVAA